MSMMVKGAAGALCGVLATTAMAAAVNFIECPKCDKRLQIADDGKSATVNLARLKDDAPDAATLEKRKQAMCARAEAYRRRGAVRANVDLMRIR